MKNNLRGLIAVATLAALPALACAGPDRIDQIERIDQAGPAHRNGPERSGSGHLTFSYEQSHDAAREQAARGGDGRIDFSGSLTTPTPCYELSAAYEERGQRVVVTLTPEAFGDVCAQVITHNTYEGAVSRLEPGTYTLQVIHRLGNEHEVAHEEEVTVR